MESQVKKQQQAIKAKYPDAIVLFKVNTFYEAIDGDAITISNALGIMLTHNKEQMSLAGFPFHRLESYLHKLCGIGYTVAILDQTL